MGYYEKFLLTLSLFFSIAVSVQLQASTQPQISDDYFVNQIRQKTSITEEDTQVWIKPNWFMNISKAVGMIGLISPIIGGVMLGGKASSFFSEPKDFASSLIKNAVPWPFIIGGLIISGAMIGPLAPRKGAMPEWERKIKQFLRPFFYQAAPADMYEKENNYVIACNDFPFAKKNFNLTDVSQKTAVKKALDELAAQGLYAQQLLTKLRPLYTNEEWNETALWFHRPHSFATVEQWINTYRENIRKNKEALDTL